MNVILRKYLSLENSEQLCLKDLKQCLGDLHFTLILTQDFHILSFSSIQVIKTLKNCICTTGSFSKIVWVFKLTVQHVILNKLRVVDYLRMFTDYSRTFYFCSIDTRTASCDYCIFTSFLGKIIQVFTPHLFFFSTNVMLH